jgi:hypothetical protein
VTASPSSLRVLIVGIVLATTGCDKAARTNATADAITPAGAPALDLSARPQLLFQLFGDADSTKMVPIAAVVGGTIRPIGLTAAGWRALDSVYFAPGTQYPVYRDDRQAGTATILRGMWIGGSEPLVSLAGCRAVMPLAASRLKLDAKSNEPAAEYLASSAPLVQHGPAPAALASPTVVAALGRRVGHALGALNQMDAAELDSLDFAARLLVTGASKEPTLLASFIDPVAGDLGPGVGHTSHVFVLADKLDTGYVATYRHAVSGDARAVEFQRIVDHVDVDGDGVDEIILETWRYAQPNQLVVLAFKAGQWHEALRVKQGWCLDAPKKK